MNKITKEIQEKANKAIENYNDGFWTKLYLETYLDKLQDEIYPLVLPPINIKE